MKDIFFRKEILKRPGAAEEALRRRHRRRRLARPRDRVLPGDPPRHHERRGAREELHRVGRSRAQHDDHPLELPHARGGSVLHRERQALREALCRSRLQHDVLAARAFHAGSLGPFARGAERTCRGEQAAGHRQPRDRPAGSEEALPPDPHRRGRDVADPGRALPPAGRDHPARRRRLGLRQAGGPARGRDPPGCRGDGLRRQGREGLRRQDEPGRHLVRHRPQRHRRLVDAGRSPGGRAAADHRVDPAGVRDRAREAVPRQDHRLGADAHLLLPDRSRRVPDRGRGRAVSDLLEQGHVPVHRVRLPAHPRALPAAPRDEDPAPLDRPL